jgi:hypothetical protein
MLVYALFLIEVLPADGTEPGAFRLAEGLDGNGREGILAYRLG